MTAIRSACRTVASRCAIIRHRATRHQPLEGALDDPFAFRVERTGGLVQQQDRPVGEDRAGDREPLSLTTGQLHAALSRAGR
jgi:hypothetical protein